jgi:hypothetical protein
LRTRSHRRSQTRSTRGSMSTTWVAKLSDLTQSWRLTITLDRRISRRSSQSSNRTNSTSALWVRTMCPYIHRRELWLQVVSACLFCFPLHLLMVSYSIQEPASRGGRRRGRTARTASLVGNVMPPYQHVSHFVLAVASYPLLLYISRSHPSSTLLTPFCVHFTFNCVFNIESK